MVGSGAHSIRLVSLILIPMTRIVGGKGEKEWGIDLSPGAIADRHHVQGSRLADLAHYNCDRRIYWGCTWEIGWGVCISREENKVRVRKEGVLGIN